MLLLRRHLLPLLRAAASPLPSPTHHRACNLSASAAPFCLEDYLVTACGLDPAHARTTAKKAFDESSRYCNKAAFEDLSWSRLNSASNPDAVLALLSGVGLSRADIAAVVAADPLLLRASAKNIGPRLSALHDCLGLSAPQIVRFLFVGSRALRACDVGPRLEFLISFYGSFERLLAAIRGCPAILESDLERKTKPNVALLRQCGLSVRDIAKLCSAKPRLLVSNPKHIKVFAQRAVELGVPPSSPLFWRAMSVVSGLSEKKVTARLEFLKSALGCSESELATSVSRMPSILGLSEECLHRKIRFLIDEVGLQPQYILQTPTLFTFSLENRLVPRHCVMKLLQAKGYVASNQSFRSLALYGEETFKSRYVDCHKDSVPGLADAYAAARAGVVPTGV